MKAKVDNYNIIISSQGEGGGRGKRKRVVNTEAELKQQGTNWSGMARAAQNRVRWRGVVDGLCSTGSDGHK